MGYVPPPALSRAILEDRRAVVENRFFNAPGDSLERPVAGDSFGDAPRRRLQATEH
jgi:hypothetical protein